MCMRNYQANLQAPTVPAVASALMDRQMRTRMFQGGVTSYTESEFTKKQQKKKNPSNVETERPVGKSNKALV